jgi:hypothetical protein
LQPVPGMARPFFVLEGGRQGAHRGARSAQRGSSAVQTLVLLAALGLGGAVSFKALGRGIDDRSRCVGESVSNLAPGTGRCGARGSGLSPGDVPPPQPPDPPGTRREPPEPPRNGRRAGPDERPREPRINFGEVDQVEHTARPAPPVRSESQEFDAVTGYIADEVARNVDSAELRAIRALNDLPGPPPPAAYALFLNQVGTGRPWDHKGAIQNAYGLSTPVPGEEGEISWDVWSNIHYGIVGREAGFSADELHGGAERFGGGPNRGDRLAVQIGIDLYEQYGSDVTEEQIRQAVVDHYDEFGEAGKVYGDPRYLPEGWDTPYCRRRPCGTSPPREPAPPRRSPRE